MVHINTHRKQNVQEPHPSTGPPPHARIEDFMEHTGPDKDPLSTHCYPFLASQVPSRIGDSPVPHLLESLELPTSDETCTIRSTIDDAVVERKIIDRAVEKAEAAVRKLKEQQERLNNYIHTHASLIAPVRKLSHDILGEIFLLVAQAGATTPLIAALRLARTCRAWRYVALSTGRLWSEIRVWVTSKDDINKQMEMVNLCLSRSQECALDVKIQASIDISIIMDVLLPHSNRWRWLELQAPTSTHNLLVSAKGNFAYLKILQLSIRYQPGVVICDTFKDIFADAPLLEHVARTPPLRLDSLNFSLGQLKHWMGVLSIEDVLTLSEQAPSLETLTFLDPHTSRTAIYRSVPPMSRLRALRLSFRSSLPHINELPEMPALRALTIRQATWTTISPEPFIAFARRMPKCLTSFNYHGRLHSDRLIQVLEHLPNLTNLSLSDVPRGPFLGDIFRQLTYHPHFDISRCLLPRLETCNFDVRNRMSEHDLLGFLYSRWFVDSNLKPTQGSGEVAALRSVTVTHHRNDCSSIDTIRARIHVLRSQGLDVRVTIGNISIPQKASPDGITDEGSWGIYRAALQNNELGDDEDDDDEEEDEGDDDDADSLDADDWDDEESEVDYWDD